MEPDICPPVEIKKEIKLQNMMKNYYKRRDMTPGKLVQELKGEGAVRQIKNINTQIKKTSELIDKKATQKQASAMKK